MSSEQAIQQEIRLALGHGAMRLFRNNTGALRDESGRLVRFGLCEGSSDLIGLRRVEVTEELLGQMVGQFVALEVKTARGRVTEQQERFLAMVRQMGGVAEVVRSVEEAKRLLGGW